MEPPSNALLANLFLTHQIQPALGLAIILGLVAGCFFVASSLVKFFELKIQVLNKETLLEQNFTIRDKKNMLAFDAILLSKNWLKGANFIIQLSAISLAGILCSDLLMFGNSLINPVLIFGLTCWFFMFLLPRVLVFTFPNSFHIVAIQFNWLLLLIPNKIADTFHRKHYTGTYLFEKLGIDLLSLEEVLLKQEEPTQRNEENMLDDIVKHTYTRVSDISISKFDMVTVMYTETYSDLLAIIKESAYSRIPVVHPYTAEIVGILYIKDLIAKLGADQNWQQLIRKPHFVNSDEKILDLLEFFKVNRIHMAMVTNKSKELIGLVTMEDIIEEIVGEIEDEFDATEIYFRKVDETKFIFTGKTPLSEFFKVLHISPESFADVLGNSETLAGFLQERFTYLPKLDEVFSYKNYKFKIYESDKRRIKRVLLTIASK